MNWTWPSPKRTLTPPGWNEKSSSLAPALLPWATKVPVRPVGTASLSGETCCWGAGDAVTLVGLGPAPVAAIGREPPAGPGSSGLLRRHDRLAGVLHAVASSSRCRG